VRVLLRLRLLRRSRPFPCTRLLLPADTAGRQTLPSTLKFSAEVVSVGRDRGGRGRWSAGAGGERDMLRDSPDGLEVFKPVFARGENPEGSGV